MGFFYILGGPLGYAIYFIYKIVQNYGLSILIFTIFLKIALTPLYIKQQKVTARMSAFNPLITEINKKYSNNPRKRSEELQKLYIENKINPGANFFPTALQLFVLLGMMDVVYRPLTHILHLSNETIDKALEVFKLTDPASFGRGGGLLSQINLINNVISHPDRFEGVGEAFVDSVCSIDLNFLGFNLVKVANLTSIAILIPIFALVFSFLQTLIMLKKKNMMQMTGFFKFFMLIMPVFSCFITLTVPIGVSIYWIVGYIFQIFQSLFLDKFCNFEQIRQEAVLEFERIRKNKNKKQTGWQAKASNTNRLKIAREKLLERYGE